MAAHSHGPGPARPGQHSGMEEQWTSGRLPLAPGRHVCLVADEALHVNAHLVATAAAAAPAVGSLTLTAGPTRLAVAPARDGRRLQLLLNGGELIASAPVGTGDVEGVTIAAVWELEPAGGPSIRIALATDGSVRVTVNDDSTGGSSTSGDGTIVLDATMAVAPCTAGGEACGSTPLLSLELHHLSGTPVLSGTLGRRYNQAALAEAGKTADLSSFISSGPWAFDCGVRRGAAGMAAANAFGSAAQVAAVEAFTFTLDSDEAEPVLTNAGAIDTLGKGTWALVGSNPDEGGGELQEIADYVGRSQLSYKTNWGKPSIDVLATSSGWGSLSMLRGSRQAAPATSQDDSRDDELPFVEEQLDNLQRQQEEELREEDEEVYQLLANSMHELNGRSSSNSRFWERSKQIMRQGLTSQHRGCRPLAAVAKADLLDQKPLVPLPTALAPRQLHSSQRRELWKSSLLGMRWNLLKSRIYNSSYSV
eukprot:SM000063S20009  [mRNA]  locus=s63:238657:241031:- [translate_table: standard]